MAFLYKIKKVSWQLPTIPHVTTRNGDGGVLSVHETEEDDGGGATRRRRCGERRGWERRKKGWEERAREGEKSLEPKVQNYRSQHNKNVHFLCNTECFFSFNNYHYNHNNNKLFFVRKTVITIIVTIMIIIPTWTLAVKTYLKKKKSEKEWLNKWKFRGLFVTGQQLYFFLFLQGERERER